MKAPTPDDLLLAALWLEQNEGEDDERGPMLRVAEWLKRQADAKYFRDACRKAGITVKEALRRIANVEQQT